MLARLSRLDRAQAVVLSVAQGTGVFGHDEMKLDSESRWLISPSWPTQRSKTNKGHKPHQKFASNTP